MGVKDHRGFPLYRRRQYAWTVDVDQIGRAFPQSLSHHAGAANDSCTEVHPVRRGSVSRRVFRDGKRVRFDSTIAREFHQPAVSRSHHFRLPSAPECFQQDVS